MAFRFSLDSVLRVRRSIERQQELKLLNAARQVVSTRREIENVERAIKSVWQGEQAELTGSVPAAQLHFGVSMREALRERQKGLSKMLLEQEVLQAQCQKEFQIAHRRREAVEILREEQRLQYGQEQARREQRQADDMFLMRGKYLKRR